MPKYASFAQLGQDIFVCNLLNWKTNGFFVEIGVGNGKLISNTYLLEKKLDWKGLLCEPNKDNIYQILTCRDAKLETNPIWHITGESVAFHNDEIREHSGIVSCFNETREDRKAYSVETFTTLSLNDALEKHKCPNHIDYISIDTEGSEYDILSTFDFKKYSVKIWSVEHNTEWRKDGIEYLNKIKSLMSNQGFEYVPNGFDGYFIKKEIYETIPKELMAALIRYHNPQSA